MRIEFCITWRCNERCIDCLKLTDRINVGGGDMTVAQARLGVDKLLACGEEVHTVFVSGGEPLLNPQMLPILQELKRLPLRRAKVYTNCVQTPPKLPTPFRWQKVPLHRKRHLPWLISPRDLAYRGRSGQNCKLRPNCGQGFDAFGFCCCPLAGSVGRLLRRNPYRQDPVLGTTEELCRHCVHILHRNVQFKLAQGVWEGRLAHPTKTFATGLVKYRQKPFVLPRFGES